MFETKRTRMLRRFQKVSTFLFSGAVFYMFIAIILVSVAQKETDKSEAFFFNRSADLIVVFTGDTGRISFGLEKLKQHEDTPMFITGVYGTNTVRSIINKNAAPDLAAVIDADRLSIDYHATNTVENVISTIHYLRKNREIKKIMIISHDYHIMRIKMIFNTILVEKDAADIYYEGLRTDYLSFRNILILCKEVFKCIRTYIFLILWS